MLKNSPVGSNPVTARISQTIISYVTNFASSFVRKPVRTEETQPLPYKYCLDACRVRHLPADRYQWTVSVLTGGHSYFFDLCFLFLADF